eukprot:m.201733 g.201733  ORF g.201733 m.201733 type:complete len:425 (+) comp21527_c0_seq1:248-1522(+)
MPARTVQPSTGDTAVSAHVVNPVGAAGPTSTNRQGVSMPPQSQYRETAMGFEGFGDVETDSPQWSEPPTTPTGEPLDMPFWFYINSIGKVDTKEMTAEVDFGIAWKWTDRRLIGWKKELPPLLWGPCLEFWNANSGMELKQITFALKDDTTGLMIRNDRYHATVKCDPDATFPFFPFDSMTIECKMSTASNWRSFDGSVSKQDDHRLVYLMHARAITPEEPLFHLWAFTGELEEWTVIGMSHEFNYEVIQSGGDVADTHLDSHVQRLNVRFHLNRKATHYVVKTMIPLWLTGIMTTAALSIPDDDIASRLAHVMTGFLAATALQFVISSEVPKVNDITVVDRLVLVTIWTLFGVMVLCIFAFHYEKRDMANFDDVSFGLEVGIPAGYTLIFWVSALIPYLYCRFTEGQITNFLPLHGHMGLKIN